MDFIGCKSGKSEKVFFSVKIISFERCLYNLLLLHFKFSKIIFIFIFAANLNMLHRSSTLKPGMLFEIKFNTERKLCSIEVDKVSETYGVTLTYVSEKL